MHELVTGAGHAFLEGGGTMGILMREKDWSTSIGDPDGWPQSLRAAVSLLLHSRFPMFLWWGDDLTMFYNDAYIPIAGDKHPAALGAKGHEVWSEVWPDVEALVQNVRTTREPSWAEDQLLYINRHGYLEPAYFTFSHSPVISEGGDVEGIFCVVSETTGKVLSGQRLAQSEQNLRHTILQAPVAMCIMKGPQHVLEIANERMYTLWGRGPDELLHKPILEGLHEVQTNGLKPLLDGVYTTGEPFVGKSFPVTLPRGTETEVVYVDFVYAPLREDDRITGIIAVASDVTPQVLVQKGLEQSEALLQQRVAQRTADLEAQKVMIRSILEASLDGVYALQAVRDENGRIKDFTYLFANNKVAQLLQRDPDDVIGSSMLQLLPENLDNGFFDLFVQVLQHGVPMQDETHFVTQNIDRWFQFMIVPIEKDTVVVTTEDITEKKKATAVLEEQRHLLDNILKNSSNGISVSRVFRDEAGTVVDAQTVLANEAAVRFTGLPREVYLTKRATEIEPEIIGSPYYQACIKTLETGAPFVMQYRMHATNRWLELTVSRLDYDHLIQVFTDVTPIKEVQLQLEQYVEELKRSNQNLEEFAYAASHDLKEPMRKIQVFSDRLREQLQDRLEGEERGFFERIMKATQRMNTLIDDLLLYSHVSKGVVIGESVDLNEKLQLVLEDLELEIADKGAIIEAGPLPVVKGHRRHLQQLLQNLVSNAIKYSRKDVRPRIWIGSRILQPGDSSLPEYMDASKAYHRIEVEDNGIGFATEDAERIFNVFTRLHGMSEYKGSGVGLSIARKVVENHGGAIWAESKGDAGACFIVLLPAA